MTPAPDRHFADTEEPGGGGIAAKRDLEGQIVSAGGDTAFETRWCYGIETRWHDPAKRWFAWPRWEYRGATHRAVGELQKCIPYNTITRILQEYFWCDRITPTLPWGLSHLTDEGTSRNGG
jgi:hypothetical protein